jgi:hypothetical protein
VIDRRVIERSSVTPTGRIDMERTDWGTTGYQALRAHLMDAVIELLRRFYQGPASTATKRRSAT